MQYNLVALFSIYHNTFSWDSLLLHWSESTVSSFRETCRCGCSNGALTSVCSYYHPPVIKKASPKKGWCNLSPCPPPALPFDGVSQRSAQTRTCTPPTTGEHVLGCSHFFSLFGTLAHFLQKIWTFPEVYMYSLTFLCFCNDCCEKGADIKKLCIGGKVLKT